MAKRGVPNNLLREARERLFGTQQALADAANQLLAAAYLLTANDIGKLERGVVERPSAPRRKALRAVCQVSADAEIGFVRRPTHETVPEPRELAESQHHVQVTSTVASRVEPPSIVPGTLDDVPPPAGWQIVGYLVVKQQVSDAPAMAMLTAAIGRSPGIDGLNPAAVRLPAAPFPDAFDEPDEEWDSFLTVTRLLASQRQAVAPAALLSLVEAHRDCLSTLFRKAQSDPLQMHIGALLAEASIVASRLWSAQGNRSMALAHCAYARKLADDLQNPALAATARIFESNLHSEAATLIGTSGDLITGLRLLQEAAEYSAVLHPAAKARLAAEQAQAFAVLKLRRECEDALKRATTAADDIDGGDRTGLFSDWNPSRLQVYEGTCRLFLDEPKKAVTALEQALRGFASDQSNTNVSLAARIDLASAYAPTDLDKSCTMIADAYSELVSIGNRRGIDRAERARERLNPWNGERAVRELDERMASYRAA